MLPEGSTSLSLPQLLGDGRVGLQFAGHVGPERVCRKSKVVADHGATDPMVAGAPARGLRIAENCFNEGLSALDQLKT